MLVETVRGWSIVARTSCAPSAACRRAALATFSDQQISRATVARSNPPSGERVQFTNPPDSAAGQSQSRPQALQVIHDLDDFERGLFKRTAIVSRTFRCRSPPSSTSSPALKVRIRYAVLALGSAQAPDHRRRRQDRLRQDHLHERTRRGIRRSADHDQDTSELMRPTTNVVTSTQGMRGLPDDAASRARSVPAHERTGSFWRSARRRMLPLRAPRRPSGPGKHHQRPRRQLRPRVQAGELMIRERPAARAHEQIEVAARRRRGRLVSSPRRARALRLGLLRASSPAPRALGRRREVAA